MKNYIFLLVFVLCSVMASGSYGRDVKRLITRSFTVVGGMQLVVDNKYGDIIVKTWDSNVINFLVEIKGKGRKEDMAQRMADRVKIGFMETTAAVTARTVIAGKKEECSDCGVEINYTIQVPRNIKLNLVNKYGNILLDRTGFAFCGDISYGDMQIGELEGVSNRIVCKYGNVFVDKATSLDIDASHSDVTVNVVKVLTLLSAYSSMKIGTAERMITNSKYDVFQIRKVGGFYANPAKYTNIRIETLDKNLSVEDMAYGELRVSRLSVDLGRVMVNSTYSNIVIGVSPQDMVRLDVLNRSGSINVSRNLNVSRLDFSHGLSGENDVERVIGRIGESSENQVEIVIRNSHGRVRLGE